MSVTTRSELIEYCLRKLGKPVITINVDSTQSEDRVDEAIEVYQEFHSDATFKTYLKHLVTETDVTNGYITIAPEILFVTSLFPIQGSKYGSGFFNIKYQLHLNDLNSLTNYIGDVAYYNQLQQYLELIDAQFNGQPRVEFSRRQNRLYLFGDFEDQDVSAGDYIIAEVYMIVDPDDHTSVWNDMWLKEFTTALIKQQWGSNLSKFGNMQLPGGVVMNGERIYQEATQEISELRERVRLEQELPADFMVG